jgi:hypothetical protein
MRASVNGFISWSVAIALLSGLPVASGAQERQAGEDRWVPSLAVISGITIQDQEASVAAIDSTGTPVVAPTDGDDLAVSPYVGASLALMSPALPLPGRPRAFLGGEILPTFASTRDVVKVGAPDGFTYPEVKFFGDEELPRTGFTEDVVLGNGGRTTAEIDTLVLGATVGVAFPFELRGRPLRLKPSFGWIRYKIDVSGRAAKAQCIPFTTPPPAPATSTACVSFDPGGPDFGRPPQFGYTREIEFEAQDSQYFNGIGGGLEIELDTGRVGPFGVSLFLEGRFYRILGDRTVDLGASAFYPEVGDPPEYLPATTVTADWAFEVDPWMYRAGLGLRLHWLGSRR